MPFLTAYLSLGGNLGNRLLNLKKAITLLGKNAGIKIVKTSPLYETEPVGKVRQGLFLNGVVKIKTSLTPVGLLLACKEVERRLKRVKTVNWGPRKIDIDIILYGAEIVKRSFLTIPHKEMTKREFVLRPLVDLENKGRHPLLGKTYKKLLAEIKGQKKVKKYGKII
ncbi:MAG: 2-amino-4-hydroxy-6-hydroxymethyldihydropteridine diphosphokinase [Candidatus Firestonebacteria bacterium]|nr:2-amino-4-hydroxy-6-hydroxymethyldihydropteridine diphosphokinase [Candidatus Firestonebacteria bacterium]